ncbi:HNH endonuclease, partial [Intrasporangium sp. YIM S08009]|uniref:HNH endonuclease n=1 Tax=Intrasporangium zincisolvens TaxID=3080018 RepID=UPI002B0552B2
VAAEVALARHESPARGSRLANASVALVRHLPHTLDALSAGALNERRADLVVRATGHLEPAVRSRVDAEVIGTHLDVDDPTSGVGGWGDRELERRVRACADRLDAEAAVQRCRLAESERRVTIRPVPDTMALVTALLPVAQAVAVHAALTRAALAGKAAGDARGKGQLMADTLVERVTGQATATDVPVEVQLVMTDRALLAGDHTPAHVPGYGPVPAGWARNLLAGVTTPTHGEPRASVAPRRTGEADQTGRPIGLGKVDGAGTRTPGTSPGNPAADTDCNLARGTPVKAWVRRLFTHPDTGTLVAMDSTRRLFPAGLRRFVIARDGTCRTPWCDAPVAHIDHVTPHAEGGATSATNGQGLCVRCNLTKEQPRWHSRVIKPGPGHADDPPHTVEITTPTGHRYTSTSPPVLPMTGRPGRRRSATPLVPGARETTPSPPKIIVLELYRTSRHEIELAG